MHQLTVLPDFASWQKQARAALVSDWSPNEITWAEWGGPQPELLFDDAESDATPMEKSTAFRVPKAFLDLAKTVACHRSPHRWSLLYRVLWRITHGETQLLKILVDPDVYELHAMEKSIRHDIHKMRAFVRFREISLAPDSSWFVAWFEPAHFIVERNAKFFVDRFASMHWSILTPDRCAHWDGTRLTFTDGVTKDHAPADDTVEPLWLTYYAHIFNPARVKEAMMQSEMAKKYWKNLPEAALIPELLAEAPKRVAKMREASAAKEIPVEFNPTPVPDSTNIEVVREAARGCEACPLYRNATQTVFGEGPLNARVVFVGEQPGDQEDLAGKPFIGPAGALFDRALAEIGFDRSLAYVTNAVKHFKWEPRGKRRIHQKPTSKEIAACRPWVERELQILQPELLVCLGATAALSLLGNQIKITRDRGQWLKSEWSSKTMVTFHPSALLRMPDEALRQQNYALFVSDLTQVLEALGQC